MSVVKKIGLLLILPWLLISCSSHYASNAEHEYLKSRNGPELVISLPMIKDNIGYFYMLPPQNLDARVSIKPPIV